jgi:hypothetical protein
MHVYLHYGSTGHGGHLAELVELRDTPPQKLGNFAYQQV